MRVIAGEAKGKTLKAVPGKGTRPIADRDKESLFNILRWRLPGCSFLDLFAGTGGVGIEALSQGAERAVFVEKAPKAVRIVHENLRATGLSRRARVIQEDVFRFLLLANHEIAPEDCFDVIYVAPPQYQELWAKTLLALEEHPVLLAVEHLHVHVEQVSHLYLLAVAPAVQHVALNRYLGGMLPGI